MAAGSVAQTIESPATISLDGTEYKVVEPGRLSADSYRRLPDNLRLQRRHVGRGEHGGVAGATGVEVYKNTLGEFVYGPDTINTLFADDIQTTAAGGCDMTFLEVAVCGAGDGGPSFSITQLRMFDRCPSRAGAVMLLDFLDGTPIVLDDGGCYLVTFDLEGMTEPIPNLFWLGMAFNSADGGWIVGAPAEIGVSGDVFHGPFPCATFFGGFPANPHGSFYADVYCEDATTAFTGYSSSAPSGFLYGGDGCTSGGLNGCGDGINLNLPCETAADDISPIVPDCHLSAYSVEVVGLDATPFQIEFELFTDTGAMGPGMPIPNTRGCYNGVGGGALEVARFEFNGSTILPARFWLVWTDNNENAGPIISGAPPEIGASGDVFAVWNPGSSLWDGFNFGGNCGDEECGTFHVTVSCIGDEPTGACCAGSGTCTEGVAFSACSAGRFLGGGTCAPGQFNPPCGTAACCKSDPGNPEGAALCDDELPAACATDDGLLKPGTFCADANTDCGIGVCVNAAGGCFDPHGGPGCNDNICCNMVCAIDEFCCSSSGFDETCVTEAQELCDLPPMPPPNNACNAAFPLPLGTTAFTTIDATTDGLTLPAQCEEIPGAGVGLDDDVWYNLDAAENGEMTVSTCNEADYDSRLAAYEGCGCPATNTRLVACNDDATGCMLTSRMTFPVTAGTCYKIRVGGFPGADSQGMGDLNLTFVPGKTCPGTRGGTPVTFVTPPSGVVDARQPHPVGSLMPRQGISTIVLTGPAGAPATCFELCETVVDGSPNSIMNVVEAPAGTYTLTLARTITPNAVTTITYTGTNTTGTFISHPGNVNADSTASPIDILRIIDCLNGVNQAMTCPFGFPWSRDIDQSGLFASADILRVIDLLNGADTFNPALNTTLPSSAGCP